MPVSFSETSKICFENLSSITLELKRIINKSKIEYKYIHERQKF